MNESEAAHRHHLRRVVLTLSDSVDSLRKVHWRRILTPQPQCCSLGGDETPSTEYSVIVEEEPPLRHSPAARGTLPATLSKDVSDHITALEAKDRHNICASEKSARLLLNEFEERCLPLHQQLELVQ